MPEVITRVPPKSLAVSVQTLLSTHSVLFLLLYFDVVLHQQLAHLRVEASSNWQHSSTPSDYFDLALALLLLLL